MLKCTNTGDTVDRAMSIFPMYLQSQCVGMPRLVLQTLYGLSERPCMVRGGPRGSSTGRSGAAG